MVKSETLRHSCSHVLAQAVKELFPNVRLGIGPAIEDGFYYDFDKKEPFTPKDLEKIEERMNEIIKRDLKFKKVKVDPKKALKNEPYKKELLKEFKEPTFYQQGDFIDLCKGPHIKSTGEIKAFKLTKIAGAYWRGDSKNKQLQRIYGVVFPTKKELKEYLHLKEEAEKRNHLKLGRELDLFSFHEEGQGFPFWHPKGMIIRESIENFWKEEHIKNGYTLIKTPIILSKELWVKSGHWENYKEFMYLTKIDNRDYAIKPMNCPGGILIYKEKLHSYKEFPLKVGELGLVHRHELSGVLSGLFRVRCFTQDDAHIYCLPEQVKDEVKKIIDLTENIYKVFGFKEYHIELSTMPEKHIGSEEVWKKATDALKSALKEKKIEFKINEGEGAFYGPKIDFHLKDSLGRSWQCGTIQVDFAMPEKLNLTYLGADDKRHKPVMIHRTILGSLERFIGVLVEHYGGKFPLWLAPVQVKLMTVTDRNVKFAKEIEKKLEENKIRVELDDRTETISRKVREAQLEKVSRMVTIGDKEIANKTLAVRTLDGKVQFGVKVDDFVCDILKLIDNKNG